MSNARKVADLGGSGTLPASQVSGLGSLATKSSVSATTEVTGLGALATKSSVGTSDLADAAVTTVKVADLNVTPAKQSQKLTFATPVATTSGTSFDFTGIPSWVKRITIMFRSVSTNGTTTIMVRCGTSGGIVSSGYVGISGVLATSTAGYADLTGFTIQGGNAGYSHHGVMTLTLMDTNTWVASGVFGNYGVTNFLCPTAGSVALGGTLDRVRITTLNGTDTFDSGLINIAYE